MNTSKNNIFNFFIFPGVRLLMAIVLVCLVLSSILGFQVPKYVAELSRHYDLAENYYESIKKLLILFVGVYFNRVIYQLLLNKYIKLLVQHTRVTIYEKWLLTYELFDGVDVSHRDKYPQGEVMTRIMSDTMALRELMTSGTFGIIIDIFFVVSCLVGFITINTMSGIFLVGAEVLATLLLIWGGKYMRTVFHSVRKSKGALSQLVANVLGGVREVYFGRHEQYASKRGKVVFDDFLHKQLHANIWDASYYSVAESLYPLLLALVVFVFPYSRIVEAAVVFAIVDLIQRSIDPIKSIAGKITNIQRAATGIGRIQEFTQDLDKGVISRGKLGREGDELASMSVSIPHFSYRKQGQTGEQAKDKSNFSLQDIAINAGPGELIGIAGASGCGKSTLLNILAGNIVPKDALVELKMVSGASFQFPSSAAEGIIRYREHVGIVSQESHIFSEDLRFNLTLQLPEETPNEKLSDENFEQFWTWIKQQIPYLQSWGFKPEDKISPQLLSMGQSQLVSALRSLYLKKPVVLFDEVSSGLDSELEYALRKVVLLIQARSLTFLVAHRLETIMEAQQILVMDQGKIVDRGEHSQLLQKSPIYQDFIHQLTH